MFFRFANFYRRFIQGFSRIAASYTSMLKTLSTKLAEQRKSGVGVNSDSRAGRDGIDNIKVNGGETGDNEIRKKGQKTSKSKNLSKSKKIIGLAFLTLRARLAFTKLRQAFVKVVILLHFNPECHI